MAKKDNQNTVKLSFNGNEIVISSETLPPPLQPRISTPPLPPKKRFNEGIADNFTKLKVSERTVDQSIWRGWHTPQPHRQRHFAGSSSATGALPKAPNWSPTDSLKL